MYKALAVLRTAFLLFIVAYTVWTMLASWGSDAAAFRASNRATWMAIAWIAFETAVGWILATHRPRPRTTPSPLPGTEPPVPPR
jgi:hypothetical protein